MICGAGGQLGWELRRTAPPDIDLSPFTSRQLDITRKEQVADTVAGIRPALIINGAAYTAVDRAEQESDLAFAVNGRGVANLAEAARQCGARLIHISTDFVFDGSQSHPYLPTDETNPLSVYGASKREGEKLALAILPDALIVRTAWVYSSHGANFVKTMLRLMNDRETIGVVADQVGSPTWANGLARTLWQLSATGLHGIHHWTDSGVASWYDFAVAIH
jgi:dTDP-4-dehydrorhamnose reductase